MKVTSVNPVPIRTIAVPLARLEEISLICGKRCDRLHADADGDGFLHGDNSAHRERAVHDAEAALGRSNGSDLVSERRNRSL